MSFYHPGEKSIKSGNLYKKGKINKSWQKRWCILSRDSKLFYHKQPNEKHSGFVDLRQCIIKQSECNEKENIFEINTTNRIFLFSADSKQEMQDWIRNIYTHSKVQQENDLIERAEYIIRDQSLCKSNLEDEFLKSFKQSFTPYLYNNQQQQQQPQTSQQHNQNTLFDNQEEFIDFNDPIQSLNVPSSLLSFNYHNNNNGNNQQLIEPPSLSSYIPISTKSLYNNFNSITNREYNHPLDLIINNNNSSTSSSTNTTNNTTTNTPINNTPISTSPKVTSPYLNRNRTHTIASTVPDNNSNSSVTNGNISSGNENDTSDNSNQVKDSNIAQPSRRFSFIFPKKKY